MFLVGIITPISDDETLLAFPAPFALSQIRSDFCSSLMGFRARMSMADSFLYPSCQLQDQTARHVFTCIKNRSSSLASLVMWKRMVEVIQYFSSTSLFSNIAVIFSAAPPSRSLQLLRSVCGAWKSSSFQFLPVWRVTVSSQASSPVCTELEMVVMDWLGKMLALPEAFLHTAKGDGGGVIQVQSSHSFVIHAR